MSRRKEFNKPDKIYVCDLRKKPKIKQETHKIMGVPLHFGVRYKWHRLRNKDHKEKQNPDLPS